MNEDLRAIGSLLHEVKGLTAPTATGNATITVNAGGVGVWVACTAAILSCALTVILTVFYIDQARRIDDMKDYLNAIYMMAPHLKPPEEKK